MTPLPVVSVASLGLWMPGYPSVDAWTNGGGRDGDATLPRGTSLKPRDRRRASLLGRALADVSAQAMAAADVDPARVQIVVGSSIAEASTLLGILDQTWRKSLPVSPAAFAMSVHNAASGLLSISHGNRGFVTSLAADEDTPAAALLEGIGLALTADLPVLVACCDEAAPEDLVPAEQSWDMLAAALVLRAANHSGPSLARLAVLSAGLPDLPPAALPAGVGNNPQAGLADLVLAIAREARGTLRLDRGTGRGQCALIAADDS